MLSKTKWVILAVGTVAAAAFLTAAEQRVNPPQQPPTPPAAGPLVTPALSGLPGEPVKKPTVDELRKKFPFESIAGRLDYETAGAEAFAKSDPAPTVTAATLKRLDGVERGMINASRWGMRVQSLQLLHSDQAQRFIDRDGFGQQRMPTPSTMFLALPTAPTIPFATARDAANGDQGGSTEAAKAPKDDVLAQFHQQGLFNFLNPNGFGYIKDREHVAGFQSHQFRQMPILPTGDKAPAGTMEQWAVLRMELVSLLKHDQPVVYVTRAMPRMEDVKDAPTRPLIPFEEKGLKALKEGEDLATESSGDRIHMVGSLRATKQCMECHQVKRGDLLGAFSWELQRQTVKAEEVLP
jgi:hypothetical protein